MKTKPQGDNIFDKPKLMPQPDLRGRELKIKKGRTSIEVTFPVSYRYNGGIVLPEGWYPGYEVPPPILPDGYKLVSLGVGLQLNCRPPYATMLLKKIDKPT